VPLPDEEAAPALPAALEDPAAELAEALDDAF